VHWRPRRDRDKTAGSPNRFSAKRWSAQLRAIAHLARDRRQEGEIQLGGAKRQVVVLFSDIRGFTPLSERMSPDEIAGLLTDYFTEMVEIVFEHGGTLDKFMGDALMALWGAPISRPDDAEQATQAAIAMQRALVAPNEKWKEEKPEIGVGIGINYGDTFAGNIGSHLRLEYTVIETPSTSPHGSAPSPRREKS
jgi:class 3 adenylate cyclase